MTTKLTKNELKAIEDEVLLLIGDPPTVETLRDQGITQNDTLIAVLDGIQSFGRVTTLMVAEVLQSAAALIIGVVFALMEYQRVLAGATALGQSGDKASLIAFAVVTANVIHPIYSLRALRGKRELIIKQPTLRGYLESFWARLVGKPATEQVDLYHNPTLHVAAAVITWSTVLLAVYDILAPLITQILTNTLTRPALIAVIELAMGLGLSIAGVFFLQSASHEIGVRTLVDQPQRIADVLDQKIRAYEQQRNELRESVRTRVMSAKVEDTTRTPNPFGSIAPAVVQGDHVYTVPSVNGNGYSNNGNGNGKNN